MENRAIVILFNGNDIPENVIGRISKEISTWCEADIEKISFYSIPEAELAKIVTCNIIAKNVNDSKIKCQTADDAIRDLSSIIDLNTTVPLFVINLSTYLMKILDRRATIGLTERDKKLLNAIITLGQGNIRSSSVATKYHYTKDIDSALRTIYKRIFDENGKIKE